MSASEHSLMFYEKQGLIDLPTGTHRVKYLANEDWDFYVDIAHKPIDLSLVLPHFRARNQPIEHRISMYIANDSAPIKLKVCRSVYRSKFELQVRASTSDVTIWLPSDFKGVIQGQKSAKSVKFSDGFVNRIMANVRLNDNAVYDEDEVVVATRGNVTFRMWDVNTNAPECVQKETFKRLFGCSRKAPETSHDWDFLLEA
ncbi:hypothetical protein MIND_01009900 [Mycena indigotica]|uniref:DUF7330 domain-containing protein n=1 Tax=Mycena indigotica TaxID=2126181 RepID=A0A8H6S813_9AGAR|nr:uncharacterized protein MIND_01009900 [Mycena indigotica]KAF7294725.1 hypothetical protein MIND_01009900 [Mycena indigotica]